MPSFFEKEDGQKRSTLFRRVFCQPSNALTEKRLLFCWQRMMSWVESRRIAGVDSRNWPAMADSLAAEHSGTHHANRVGNACNDLCSVCHEMTPLKFRP